MANRLSRADDFAVRTYLLERKEELETVWTPLAKLAERVTGDLNIAVTEHNLRGILDTTDITRKVRDQSPAAGGDPVAEQLAALAVSVAELKEEILDGLRVVSLSVAQSLLLQGAALPPELAAFVYSEEASLSDKPDLGPGDVVPVMGVARDEAPEPVAGVTEEGGHGPV